MYYEALVTAQEFFHCLSRLVARKESEFITLHVQIYLYSCGVLYAQTCRHYQARNGNHN